MVPLIANKSPFAPSGVSVTSSSLEKGATGNPFGLTIKIPERRVEKAREVSKATLGKKEDKPSQSKIEKLNKLKEGLLLQLKIFSDDRDGSLSASIMEINEDIEDVDRNIILETNRLENEKRASVLKLELMQQESDSLIQEKRNNKRKAEDETPGTEVPKKKVRFLPTLEGQTFVKVKRVSILVKKG